ncbi:MAG: redoxin domain-containing protein [Candidatus Synoicihabitans palmerolidicus]|nr:redoxin domain-containing protein [Candidatus Synoicihabitans palmerolidicus]
MQTSSLKLIIPLASLLVGFAVSSFAAQAKVGELAPDFALTAIDGVAHRLSDFQGKTVVLEWVNPECPFVVKHYESGNMLSLQKSATADGVVWWTINSGSAGAQGDYSAERVARWMESTRAAPSAYFRDQDGEVGRLYGAKTTPHMYVVNPDGTLIYNGAIDSIASANRRDLAKAQNYVVAALAASKSGRMPEKTASRPYGCSVKY